MSSTPPSDYDWLYADDRRRAAEATGQAAATNPSSGHLPPPNLPPPGASGSAPKPPKKRRRGRWGLVKLLFTLWLVFMIAVPFVAWSKVTKISADPGDDRPAAGSGKNVLLVGSDKRPTDKSRGRTDTILILHYGSGPTVLTSIPRDSLVPIPGYGTTKINAAYAYGGAPLLIRTIEDVTGLRIDGYVQIGFTGLVDVVDALGGIEVCPEEDMKDADSKLDISKGCQQVDGKTALAYSRNRHTYATGDVARGQAQREVIGSIGAEVRSPWTFLNPFRYATVATSTAESLTVDDEMSVFSFGWFAWKLSGAMSGSGLSCTVPLSDLSVRWDRERALAFFGHLENGTADQLGDLCTADGFPED